ncbi:MAG: HAD family hydrolase [Candidatus Acetothermia bacterium]|nr:HAD family hydrolase [Candidatus Acetothermia bacterium]
MEGRTLHVGNRALLGELGVAIPSDPRVEELEGEGRTVVFAAADGKLLGALGIDAVFAEVKPEEKAQVVRGLQQEGHVVAMVGDGINDAPALVVADVGMVRNDPRDVTRLVRLSRAVMRKMRQNLVWATTRWPSRRRPGPSPAGGWSSLPSGGPHHGGERRGCGSERHSSQAGAVLARAPWEVHTPCTLYPPPLVGSRRKEADMAEPREERYLAEGLHGGEALLAAVDALPFYVMLVDAHHRILFANRAAAQELGVQLEALRGQYCPQAVHGCDGPVPGCPLGEAVAREVFDPARKRWVRSAVYPTGLRTQGAFRCSSTPLSMPGTPMIRRRRPSWRCWRRWRARSSPTARPRWSWPKATGGSKKS